MVHAPPRLRFAPSPTGTFHVGGARTALFNWLYVRRHQGTFVLRIEDTDEERNSTEWVDGILDAMRWLGLDWDEGPYSQSANRSLHVEAALKLYEQGDAYYCDCTREQIDERAKVAGKPGYDRHCRERGLVAGPGCALRFKVPPGKTIVHDLVRGEATFDNDSIEDFVILRSTGMPMFNLSNVVDDMDQHITHVVRGEEHLPNTPKQMLLWKALSGQHPQDPPVYAHLPVIVNEKRQKLSKRRDKVALEMYRDEGYLPEAMRNYLALIGWAPKGDREIVSLDELINEFDFKDVNKASGFFDVVKLTHMNGEYVRALSLEDFTERCQPFLQRSTGNLWPAKGFDMTKFDAIAPLVQERVAKLDEVGPMIDFLFVDKPQFDEAALKAVMEKPASMAILQGAIDAYETCEWSASVLHDVTLAIGEANGLKLGKAQAPIRLAVTGKKVGPPLFESLEILGRQETMARLIRLRDLDRP